MRFGELANLYLDRHAVGFKDGGKVVRRRIESKLKGWCLTCPLKTNPNLERESKDSGVCKEAGNDEEAIHERTDYPQAEGSRS